MVYRRTVEEALRRWIPNNANGRLKSENYFNRQFTDHVRAQLGALSECLRMRMLGLRITVG